MGSKIRLEIGGRVMSAVYKDERLDLWEVEFEDLETEEKYGPILIEGWEIGEIVNSSVNLELRHGDYPSKRTLEMNNIPEKFWP